MIPSFGVKKAQPAFQVKAAASASSAASSAPPASAFTAPLPSASLDLAANPVNSSLAPAAEPVSPKAPAAPALALAPTSTLPTVVPPQDAGATVCSSDEDFEKENIHIDPKGKKKPPAKSKKSKVKKDPGAPKKPATSYMLFCKQVRFTIVRLQIIYSVLARNGRM